MNKLSRVIFVLLFWVISFNSNGAKQVGVEGHFTVLPEDFKQESFPCVSLQVTEIGAVCNGHYLAFPEVRLEGILEREGYLPHQSQRILISEEVVDGVVYRNVDLKLLWEPATPEFLQIHLKEYLPYWENRIPYRLLWKAQYEICTEGCSTLHEQGEFLPADIENLSPALAADVDFNGVPAAFWNQNIKP